MEGFDDLIKAWWLAAPSSIDPAENMVLKLRYLRAKLKKWNKETNESIIQKKVSIKRRIMELDAQEEVKCLTSEEQKTEQYFDTRRGTLETTIKSKLD